MNVYEDNIVDPCSLAASTGSDVGSRSFRDAALRRKVSQLIDQLLHTVFSGTGKQKRDLLAMESDPVPTIDSPNGWVFAYEGGAHILFRHCRTDPRFVCRKKYVFLTNRRANCCDSQNGINILFPF
jgi:hypothetical protein